MNTNEKIHHDLQFNSLVIGVDEVGRGALSGDLYVAATSLRDWNPILCNPIPSEYDFLLDITDSKKLSPQKRESLSAKIHEYFYTSIQAISVKQIDRYGISWCLNTGFNLSVNEIIQLLPNKKITVLVDGTSKIKNLQQKQLTIKKGDLKSLHIAAASIIAKVARDNYMSQLHHNYPDYDWQANKGYGTNKHINTIKNQGPSPEHRQLFLRKILPPEHEQLPLFKPELSQK